MFGFGVEGIMKQFQTNLKTYIPPNISHAAFDKNMEKNRYKDVLCIDETRVVLQMGEADYIHANYVKGDPLQNPFICTQGPLQITVNDFWIMVMQERVSNIIMLCNIVEAGKDKCFQYWPQDAGSSLKFGEVQITCAEVNDSKDTTFIISVLQAENKDTRLTIKHIRWKEWPDKGVPTSILAPFRILKIVRQSLHRATIVHCSAGIGRTGCIVAIEMGLQQILSGKPLFLIDMIKKLRSMRMSAVQTDEQLVYVVRCLVAYADVCGLFNSKPELQEKAEKFSNDYTAMLALKKAARVHKVTALPEAERIAVQATVVKVEEKKEEPSQRSIQEILERGMPVVQKQLQPIQISENEKQLQKIEQPLSPSSVPIPQSEKPIQPLLLPVLVQQFKKPSEQVLSPFVPLVQESPKQIQPQPPPVVVPVQQVQQQTESPPIQETQNQIQP
uniref:Tyrosine phosphatase n=1 Tax=Elaeophora elaphi TaxID=1147741 RepID=A0A0R3S4X2_9BILA